MKARKTIAIFAPAIAAIATTATFGARIDDPCPRSNGQGLIVRVESSDHEYSETSKAHIGDTVYFKMLVGNKSSSGAYDVPWKLKYIGVGSADFDLAMGNTPAIAVTISGETRYAKLVTQANEYNSQITEFKFSYLVRPGDMANPMTLVGENNSKLEFLNLYPFDSNGYWQIVDTNELTYAQLQFSDDDIGAEEAIMDFKMENHSRNSSKIYGLGAIYIETVDFDDEKTQDGFWREIPMNSELADKDPKVVIKGGGAETNGTVYVWISDETGTNVSENLAFGDSMGAKVNGFGQPYISLSFGPGDEELPFTLKGLSTNGNSTAYLYLSSAREPSIATGFLVSNYTYRVVKVTEPLPPSIRFTLDNYTPSCSTNWHIHAAELTVHLSEPYSEDVVVDLGMHTATKNAQELFDANIVGVADKSRLQYPDDNPAGANNFRSTNTTVVVKAGSLIGTAYIYALGSGSEGISFFPTIMSPSSAATYYDTSFAIEQTISIAPCDSVATLLDQSGDAVPLVDNAYNISFIEEREDTYYIQIADSYRNITTNTPGYKGYTVEWDRGTGNRPNYNPQTFTNVWPILKNSKWVLPVTLRYSNAGQFTDTSIKITSEADGAYARLGKGTAAQVVVTVGESMKAHATPNAIKFAEGDRMSVSFSISQEYMDLDSNNLYAFLVPLNEDASNKTFSVNFNTYTNGLGNVINGKGIRIRGTNSVGTATVEMLDGDAEPKFDVVFCASKSDTFDKAKIIDDYVFDEGEILKNDIVITNVVPSQRLEYNRVKIRDGETFGNAVVVDVPATFKVIPSDPANEYDMGSSEPDKCILVYWEFFRNTNDDPNDKTKIPKEEADRILTTNLEWKCTFYESGSNNFIRVTLFDKDMRKPGDFSYNPATGKWDLGNVELDKIPSSVYRVNVDSRPRIKVLSRPDQFYEYDFLYPVSATGDMAFNVWLTETATTDLDVRLHIERMGEAWEYAGVDNLGILEANTNVLGRIGTGKGREGSASPGCTFRVSDLDGTPNTVQGVTRFKVWAEVTTTNMNNNAGVRWNEYYVSETNEYFVVYNSNPTIVSATVGGRPYNTETNAYTVSANEELSVKWTIKDVCADLTNDFKVIVTCPDGTHTFTYKSNSVDFDKFTKTVKGEYKFMFTASDKYVITLEAQDKDGGSVSMSWHFVVAASKNLYLLPHVRDGEWITTPQTGEITPYLLDKARGIGSGRIWAVTNIIGARFSAVADFEQKWVYPAGASSARFAAKGYQVGDVEGSLGAYDVDITPKGDKHPGGNSPHYTYPSGLDSFFYRWSYNTKGDGGWEANLQSPNPQWGKNASVSGSIPLPDQQEDPTKAYDDIMIEAVFSKEFYASDNLGDINQDGIPDYYARTYAEETGDEDGLKSISSFNDDEDYFPAVASQRNPLSPDTPNWGPGKPFTFRYEIRGLHEGLNEPGISDLDLSEAEMMTLFEDWVRNTGETPTNDYKVAESNALVWAKKNGWTADRRTSPILEDSDEDGYPDGYEYFFWRYSRVGIMVDGSWRRLTGSRFSLTDEKRKVADPQYLSIGVDIPSWVIAHAFDPKFIHTADGVADGFTKVSAAMQDDTHVRLRNGATGEEWIYNSNDFDEDGLSDLEEISLGTNPVHWDSDGDGLPDYYELFNGLDPLVANGGANPDRDFMARASSPKSYSVITVTNDPENDKLGWFYAIDYADSYDYIASEKVAGSSNYYYRITTTATTQDPKLSHVPMPYVPDKQVFYIRTNDLVTVTDSADARIKYLAKPAKGFLPVLVPNMGERADCEYIGRRVDLPVGLGIADVEGPMDRSRAHITQITKRGEPFVVGGNVVNAAGISVFRYGKGEGPYVPMGLNPDSLSEISTAWTVIAFTNHYNIAKTGTHDGDKLNLTYIHRQVYNKYGFDPRTGWKGGTLHPRWSTLSSESSGTGKAVNTAAYTALDEFLLLQYRTMTGGANGLKGAYDTYAQLVKSYNEGGTSTSKILNDYTTRPNIPFTEGKLCTTNTTSYNNDTHGADTDSDGVPDGWELYVNSNPNVGNGGDAWDTDGLTLAQEYAGTDSCLAYAEDGDYPAAEKIWANYPGNAGSGKLKGWFNKFFPTDPYDEDTDGDGLFDGAEGKKWAGWFYVGRNEYWRGRFNGRDYRFSFIYDAGISDAQKKTLRCIPGGGLNPCSVDTDSDLLPDLWEYEFAGIVVSDSSSTSGDDDDADEEDDEEEEEETDEEEKESGNGAASYSDTKAELLELDYKRITSADGNQRAHGSKAEIRGGMDGTVFDANYDYDHDGLLNFQEYMVQSLRHLRYDDAETPLMGRQLVWNGKKLEEGKFIKFLPMDMADAESFYNLCRNEGFTGSSAFKYRELGYFVAPPHDWDPHAAREVETEVEDSGTTYTYTYLVSGYYYMFRPLGLTAASTPANPARTLSIDRQRGLLCGQYLGEDACAYATTDPRRWDSDNDGMDDYYELFHGLNPLLGSAADPQAPYGYTRYKNYRYYDRIASIYTSGDETSDITAWRNAWTGWDNETQPPFDAMRFPWMMGTAECDADGDGLRNAEEALLVDITSPKPTHTDPTPLWMTDSTSTNNSSYVSQYYKIPITVLAQCLGAITWDYRVAHENISAAGSNRDYMFTFEENEGYDTDHDFVSDNMELTKNVSPASDPLSAYDPVRRQGIWFSGKNSAAITGSGAIQRPASVDYDMLRQFTVEAWVKAEKPDAAGEQIILERVSDYSGSTLSNAEHVVRANFRLGIRDGKFFGEYEGSATNSGAATLIGPVATTNWTHLALAFDGSTFAFHVNGNPNPVDQAMGMRMIPANGIVIMRQDVATLYSLDPHPEYPVSESGYDTMPTAFLLGARAMNGKALNLADNPEWTDYGSFFKGWVDEVRVWDGARTADEISGAYSRALTHEEIVANRQTIYTMLSNGKSRNDSLNGGTMPAELIQHYNFSTLPGSVQSSYAAREPNGFTQNVTDQVRIEGRPLADFGGIYCGWWASTPVHSTVYRNMNLVPWIANTVAHLPFFDGSAVDSQYWSEYVAGVLPASTTGDTNGTRVATFDFPNTANPYPYYIYKNDRNWRWNLLRDIGESGLAQMWHFQMRVGFAGTSDLVPLGDSFAKRCDSSWDKNGAMDAWELTGLDSDADGIPDWWESYARSKYGAGSSLIWSTLLDYWGIGKANVPAWEAYQRDLAQKGMLPGGRIDAAFISTADLNQNAINDYWEKMYGVTDAVDDPDYDGLSNLAEFLSSEGRYPYGVTNGFPRIDPTRSVTAYDDENQKVPDYFLSGPTNKEIDAHIVIDTNKYDRNFGNNYYLGEIFSDHDFMEDWWERGYNKPYTSASIYDFYNDYDGDGWRNWSECRYALWSGLYQADVVDSWLDKTADLYIKSYPRPAIGIRMTYDGDQNVRGKGVVVRASNGKAIRADATFVVPGADGGVVTVGNPKNGEGSLYIGRYTEGSVLHGFLNPGSLLTGSGSFWEATMFSEYFIKWEVLIGNKWYPREGSLQEYIAEKNLYAATYIVTGDLEFRQFAIAVVDPDNPVVGSIKHTGTAETIGRIDYRTGEFSLDMNAYKNSTTNVAAIAARIFAAQYDYQISREWPQTIYVSDYVFDLKSTGESASKSSSGLVKEGRNSLEVFIDMNGDGKYTPGEPFGIAKDVDVSWHKTDVIDVVLTDTSPYIPRYDISSGSSDRTFINGSFSGVTAASGEEDGGMQQSEDNSASGSKKIRIVRQKINGIDCQKRVLMTKGYFADDRTYIHDGDVRWFDLDWRWLTYDAAKLGVDETMIESATYSIEEYGVNIDGSITNKALATFINTYSATRPVAVPVAPASFAPVYSAAPVFSWTCTDDTATAFRLQVRTTDGDVIYDTGEDCLRIPGRTVLSDGSVGCRFTPPLYVDMPAKNGEAVFLRDGSNYQWRVALYNAKFRSDNTKFLSADDDRAWSAWTDFQMDVRNVNRNPYTSTGYGVATAAVRYYGPDRKDKETIVSNIIVEAYASADFTGTPLARLRLDASATNLLDSITDNTTVNAVLRGIVTGEAYLLAFIDKNNNGVRDSWESWGYANNVGRNSPYIYTPRAVMVQDSLTPSTDAFTPIYIEDTDINQNEIPDCLESSSLENAGASSADADGDGVSDSDEDGLFETEYLDPDTDNDGMPDGWEAKYTAAGMNRGTDPITMDGEDAVDGDMMAYEEFRAWLVSFSGGNDRPFLVLPSERNVYSPQVNTPAADYNLCDWYSYGVDLRNPSIYGLGTNVTLGADAYVIGVETVRVARVHAQVYAAHGFETGVATAFDKTGHSKPFTNLDKYLVCRYLQAIGYPDDFVISNSTVVVTNRVANEDLMNVCGIEVRSAAGLPGKDPSDSLWARWTLLPNTADGNLDGIADGWQLYVMFGQVGGDLAGAIPAPVTPWTAPIAAHEFSVALTTNNSVAVSNFLASAHSPAETNKYFLTWLQEYDMRALDEKHLPTDPWSFDTDGDGISDAAAYNYHLKGENLRGDADNDQLSNFVEFLVSNTTNGVPRSFPEISADHRISHSFEVDGGDQFVPDYFLRVGSLYLGEMFTDHDFMESYLETSNEVQEAVGYLDSYRYDAQLDADGDGWCNFSELRAFLEKGTMLVDMGVVTNSGSRANLSASEALALTQDLERRGLVHGEGYNTWTMPDGTYGVAWNEVTNEFREVTAYSGTPVPTVTVKVYYDGNQSISNYTVKAWKGTDTTLAAEAVWTGCEMLNGKLVLTTPDEGKLTEGMHTFVVYGEKATSGDSGSSGSESKSASWTPGAPYGVATDVDVGWKQATFSVGLSDTNASVMRFSITEMCNNNTFDSQKSLNDRGVIGMRYCPNEAYGNPGTNTTITSDGVRVRIVQTKVNGLESYKSGNVYKYANNVVFDKYINVSAVPEFTEALLVADGKYDLDWGGIVSAGSTLGIQVPQNVTSLTYRVVIGEGSIDVGNTNQNALATVFVNAFERRAIEAQTLATPIAPVNSLSGTQPTFTWRHDNAINKSYPAFKLRVYKGSTATAANMIYDSGVRRAPPRDANGVYTWTPDDLHVGEAVTNGNVFANNADYCWTVSMLDAKFTTPNSNETAHKFRTEVVSGVMSDRGAIAVAVKYFGPVQTTNSTTSLEKLIRVEAFASPDFSGAPAAVTYANDVSTIASSTNVSYNARLIGLTAGEWYVRAYIDTNGNRVRDPEESWGYGCYMHTGERKDVWTPRPYAVEGDVAEVPMAVVYIEDVDADKNGLPDAYTASVTSGSAPYYIYMDTGTAAAYSIYTTLDPGLMALPYVAMLTHFGDGENVSMLRLDYALALAGLPLEGSLFNPVVRITSFSREAGVDLTIDVPTTIDPDTLKAKNIKDEVVVTLALWATDSLGGEWEKIGNTITVTAKLNSSGSKIEQTTLDAINQALMEEMNKPGNTSKFFKVTVE